MPVRAAPMARQSVRASRFRCPRSRVSGSTHSTPSGSIARPGRNRLPAARTARIRAPWVAPQANLPTRFPFASGEAYRNRRSCAPAGVFGFSSSTRARANRSSWRTLHSQTFPASSASTASTRRTQHVVGLFERDEFFADPLPEVPVGADRDVHVPAQHLTRREHRAHHLQVTGVRVEQLRRRRVPARGARVGVPRACCWNASDACPAPAPSAPRHPGRPSRPGQAAAPTPDGPPAPSSHGPSPAPRQPTAPTTPTPAAHPGPRPTARTSPPRTPTAHQAARQAEHQLRRRRPRPQAVPARRDPPSPMAQTLDPTTEQTRLVETEGRLVASTSLMTCPTPVTCVEQERRERSTCSRRGSGAGPSARRDAPSTGRRPRDALTNPRPRRMSVAPPVSARLVGMDRRSPTSPAPADLSKLAAESRTFYAARGERRGPASSRSCSVRAPRSRQRHRPSRSPSSA